MQATDVLRVVLVGKSGVGKSSVSNSLIGQKGVFKVARSLKSVTQNSKMVPATIQGVNIEVVDTPGLFDKADEAETDKILKEILKSVALSLPGPHAFILVFNGGERFLQAETDVIKRIQELFRDHLFCYLIVVFTHIKSKEKLDELLSEVPEEVTGLITDCEKRVFGMNNKGSDEDRKPQIKELLDAIKDLRRENSARGQAFYKDALINRCLHLLQSQFADKSLEEIKTEIQREDERIIGSLTKDQPAAEEAQQTKLKIQGCTIL